MFMDVSWTCCRLRSVMSLTEGARVSFEWRRGDLPPIPLRGRIAAKRRTPDATLYEYGIEFADMREAERDKIVSILMEYQRRAAMNKSFKGE